MVRLYSFEKILCLVYICVDKTRRKSFFKTCISRTKAFTSNLSSSSSFTVYWWVKTQNQKAKAKRTIESQQARAALNSEEEGPRTSEAVMSQRETVDPWTPPSPSTWTHMVGRLHVGRHIKAELRVCDNNESVAHNTISLSLSTFMMIKEDNIIA